MIKYSLIVPVYNTEKYLKTCLNSIINQTLKDFEIIIINDGSTDGSLSIINNYASQYTFIKVINKKNSGLSASRNTGIRSASRGISFIY